MSFDSQSHPKTILVVDDDLSVLAVIKCMLEGSEYNVLLANSAEFALGMAKRRDITIDLMLVDVVMPDLSGPDLKERISAICPHQKVLFMAGFTDHEVVRVKVLDHGLRLLPKPFTPDGLLEAVQMVLSTAPADLEFQAARDAAHLASNWAVRSGTASPLITHPLPRKLAEPGRNRDRYIFAAMPRKKENSQSSNPPPGNTCVESADQPGWHQDPLAI